MIRPIVSLLGFSALALSALLGAQPVTVDRDAAIRQAYTRLYNFDFAGAHKIAQHQVALLPQDPMPHAVDAAAYLFGELARLRILEFDFFNDDDKLVDRRKLVPDFTIHEKFFAEVDTTERLGNARLALKADDRDALLAMCMVTGLVADYAALIERRRFGSFSLSKKSQIYAHKLLDLNPPVYDAYLTFGSAEYVVGSIPFFLRWLVHFDGVKGSKEKGTEELELVAEKGSYYGPFARVLLAVIHVREKRPAEATRLLSGLIAEFPENPLFKKELQHLNQLARAGPAH
jgi:hypothetical protein